MNRHLFRGSKTNHDRRDQSFARSVIAEAQRRHLAIPDDSHQDDDMWKLGTCEHCGADFFDAQEREWHGQAECVGGEERFR